MVGLVALLFLFGVCFDLAHCSLIISNDGDDNRGGGGRGLCLGNDGDDDDGVVVGGDRDLDCQRERYALYCAANDPPFRQWDDNAGVWVPHVDVLALLPALSVEFWLWVAPERPTIFDVMKDEEDERLRRHRDVMAKLEEEAGEGSVLFADGEGRFDITLQRPDRTLEFVLRGVDGSISSDENRPEHAVIAKGRTRLTAGEWHHVVAAYSTRGGCEWCGRVFLFVDGALDNVWTEVQTALPLRVPSSADFRVLSGAPRGLGSDAHDEAADGARGVAISDVRLWTVELGLSQVRSLMSEEVPFDVLDDQGRFAHYHASDGEGGLGVLHSAGFHEFGRRASPVPLASARSGAPLSMSSVVPGGGGGQQQQGGERLELAASFSTVTVVIWAEGFPYEVQDVPDELVQCWRALRRVGLALSDENSVEAIEILVVVTTDDDDDDDSGGKAERIKSALLAVGDPQAFDRRVALRVESFAADASFASVANRAARSVATGDLLVFLGPHAIPQRGWLNGLLSAFRNGGGEVGVVGSKLLYASGRVFHFGFDFASTPDYTAPSVMLPHHRARGYSALDARVQSGVEDVVAVSGLSLALPARLFAELEGFDELLRAGFADIDLCLAAAAVDPALRVIVAAESSAVFVNPDATPRLDEALASEAAARLSVDYRNAQALFTERWGDVLAETAVGRRLTSAQLSWVIHCGGSQGFEAATILQGLEERVDVRAIVRRYGECEHTDTLNGMPGAFRDSLDRAALRRFAEPYRAERYGTRENGGDGSIVVYARDYREISRWVPENSAFVVGRYMFEAHALPRPWVKNCKRIDEVWVPSAWQKEAFVSSGVDEDKIFVMPEAVDTHFYDPLVARPIALPGTSLDGLDANDPARPYVFLSVYKMEDRKGWRELIKAYLLEFEGAGTHVLLLLRTYLHQAGASGDIHDRGEILRQIYEFAAEDEEIGWKGDDGRQWPRIDVLSHHLPADMLPSLYAAADAFVLPTHGEGWGLPTMEAMAMGLPTISTAWGGSTEFMTPENSFPIRIEGLVATTKTDAWLRGFKWAQPDVSHLRSLMRTVFADPEAARKMGEKGRLSVERDFNPARVGELYAQRLDAIQVEKLPFLKEGPATGAGQRVLSQFDRKWGLSSNFKACSSTSMAIKEEDIAVPERANVCKMAVVATFPPRECGIGTYTNHLVHAFERRCSEAAAGVAQIDVVVVRHQDHDLGEYDQENWVKASIREYEVDDYTEAAKFVNEQGYGLVLLQFEFGIYGGGANILCFARDVRTRLITTVHTVSRNYGQQPEEYHTIVSQLSLLSHRLMVMTENMRLELDAFHAIGARDIAVIPHGVPSLPFDRTEGTDRQPIFPGRKIMMTFGLLHQHKGCEYMIRAMPAILEAHPDALYLIQGKPHPSGWMVKEYYESLQNEVAELGLRDSVRFDEAYVSDEELYMKLGAVYLYVNPYTDTQQAVSGTTALALGTGAAVVSTPFPYARANLVDGVGVFVEYRSSASLAETIIPLLDDDEKRRGYQRRAYEYGRTMTWDNIAEQHLDLARSI